MGLAMAPNLHALLLAGVLALASWASEAMPLAYAPVVEREAEVADDRGIEPDLPAGEEFDRVVLSEQAARDLMVSATAAPERREVPGPGARQATPAKDESKGVAGRAREYRDPLAEALRQFVQAPPGAPRAVAGARRVDDAAAFDDGSNDELLAEDEEVLARVEGIKQRLADAADWAIDEDVDAQGRPGFSVLGIGGFRAEVTGDGRATLAFRDLALRTDLGIPRATVAGAQNPDHRSRGDQEDALRGLRLVFLLWDVLTHPITLGVLILAVAYRLVAGLVGRHRTAY